MKTTSSLWVLLCFGVLIKAFEADVRIRNVDEFINFTEAVNNGTNYTGTTVFLDSDIDFSGKIIEPIGNSYSEYFLGVFDGQGYVISNLKMVSSSQYVGLFGYSKGLTIKNAILDSSCSITSSYNGSDDAYVGGIIGQCIAENKPCIIENNVNMRGISFSGSITSFLCIGGIAGYLYSNGNEFIVRNCANYGDIIHYGTSEYPLIGGVVGYSSGSTKKMYIYNVLNHGSFILSGTMSNSLYLGGIAGLASNYTNTENYMSVGGVNILTGVTVGCMNLGLWCVFNDKSIRSLFDRDLSDPNESEGRNTLMVTESSSLIAKRDLDSVNKLNNQSSANSGWNKWIYNPNSNSIVFKPHSGNGFSINSEIILLPNLAGERRSFLGWYSDPSLTIPFSSSTVSDSITLYGKWDNYFVLFDSNGRSYLSYSSKAFSYNDVCNGFPEANRTGYSFVGWFSEKVGGNKVEVPLNVTSDRTLYAQWTANKYIVSFNPNGGIILESTKTVAFDSPYGDLPTPSRTEYPFLGWFTEEGIAITEGAVVKIPGDHTLHARWIENSAPTNQTEVPTKRVEIIFGTKSITQEEAEGDIKKYTNDEFVFIVIEAGTEETRIIIEFVDVDRAQKFVRDVRAALERGEGDLIKRVRFVLEDSSFSPACYTMKLLYLV